MEPSRSNRRRLMQSYIPPLRPDLPATFESLNDDTLTTVLEFIGNKSYRSFGGLNKHCKEVYLNTPGMTKETFVYGYGPLSVITNRYEEMENLVGNWRVREVLCKGVVFYNRSDVLAWALQQQNTKILKGICVVAAAEGRIDLLNKVLINVEDGHDHTAIFQDVDWSAARGGKLKVLKWLEDKGKDINKESCADQAARYGQLHIIQWLLEERGLELFGSLYYEAIIGGQLHVMKWLKEQGCPWSDSTFIHAAEEGNLEILQWLYDEGCPWPEETDGGDELSVYEDWLEPEVIDWFRSNGYADRIVLGD